MNNLSKEFTFAVLEYANSGFKNRDKTRIDKKTAAERCRDLKKFSKVEPEWSCLEEAEPEFSRLVIAKSSLGAFSVACRSSDRIEDYWKVYDTNIPKNCFSFWAYLPCGYNELFK